MRFVFVDRVVTMETGRSIVTLKNISASEDVFDDHFPGAPVFPGALLLETFEQAAQLLIAASHDFMAVGRLARVTRATFRHLVGPGDQVRARCERVGDSWTVRASAECEGRSVATAILDFVIEPVDSPATRETAARLAELSRLARARPVAGLDMPVSG